MSRAYKCNRCGRLYEPYDGVVLKDGGEKYYGCELIGSGTFLNYPHFDLCKPCMISLIRFLNNGTYKPAEWIEEDYKNE